MNGAFESGASTAKSILDATTKPDDDDDDGNAWRPTTRAEAYGDAPLIEKYLRSRQSPVK